MSFETSLVTALTTHGGLSALIGARCEPGSLPAGTTLPAIAYVIVAKPIEQDGSGAIVGSRYHVQISALADNAGSSGAGGYAGAGAVIDQVRLALIAFASGTYEITGMSERDVDTPDPVTGLYQRSIDATLDTILPATVTVYQTSVPANAVVVYAPTEDTPRATRRMETMFDSDGALVAYVDADGMETVTVRGTLLSVVSADRLAVWADADELLSYTDRAGTTTTGWRVKADAPPNVKHVPGGTDWTVDLRLWRIP